MSSTAWFESDTPLGFRLLHGEALLAWRGVVSTRGSHEAELDHLVPFRDALGSRAWPLRTSEAENAEWVPLVSGCHRGSRQRYDDIGRMLCTSLRFAVSREQSAMSTVASANPIRREDVCT